MKARSAAVSGALAVAGLIAAYATWQRPEQDKQANVVVLDLSRSEIERIRYDDERRGVELYTEGKVTWVRSTEKPPAPPPPPTPAAAAAGADGGTQPASTVAAGTQDGGTPGTVAAASAPATPAPAPKTRELRGNESGENLIKDFAPLYAVRGLGVLPDEKLKELGLADSKRTLEVVAAGGTHRFRIADGPGAGTPYIRDEDDGKVYVVKSTLLSSLEFAASRLVDRRLHAFRDDEWNRLKISFGDEARELHKIGDRLASGPDASPDEFASNWHDRIWRMIGVDVLGRGETPATGEPEVKVRLDYLKDDKAVGFIELAESGKDVYARTEHSAGWVRVHSSAAQVISEREKVVAE